MDGIIELPWHAYPATLLMMLGLAMVAWSLYLGVDTVHRQLRDPSRALAIAQGLRIGLIGLSLVGIGSGWLWHLETLLGLSLIFGSEELLETSVVIAALKSSLRDSS